MVIATSGSDLQKSRIQKPHAGLPVIRGEKVKRDDSAAAILSRSYAERLPPRMHYLIVGHLEFFRQDTLKGRANSYRLPYKVPVMETASGYKYNLNLCIRVLYIRRPDTNGKIAAENCPHTREFCR